MIQVANFTKYYGKFKAVDNISFDVKKGTIVGFVGKNGAGKSTTLRALLNFINPTSGSCSISNLDSIKDAKKIRSLVSYMPSDAMFYHGITPSDLFRFCCQFTKQGYEVAEELSKYFELDLNKRISDLSLGNRKKVSIIQALLKDSELYILDEPTSGLDPLMQEKFFEVLLRKKEEGATIFLSSHNLIEIEKYCDRTIIIKDGEILEDVMMNDKELCKTKIITYETSHGTTNKFEFDGDVNQLIKDLSLIDLKNIEIRTKSIEEEFIKYYKGDI